MLVVIMISKTKMSDNIADNLIDGHLDARFMEHRSFYVVPLDLQRLGLFRIDTDRLDILLPP